MFSMINILSNAKNILLIAALIVAVWFFKDWQHQKSENKRQAENARQLRISDSLNLANQLLTNKEIKEYLEYQNKDLKNKLSTAGVKFDKIKSIITHNYYYKDTTTQVTDVSPLIKSIKDGIPDKQEFIDTTKCLTTKGCIIFDGSKLKVLFNDREFKNKSDAVVYQERREWTFLGIKSRFLGKRQFTAVNFDECGVSKVLKIEKRE